MNISKCTQEMYNISWNVKAAIGRRTGGRRETSTLLYFGVVSHVSVQPELTEKTLKAKIHIINTSQNNNYYKLMSLEIS